MYFVCFVVCHPVYKTIHPPTSNPILLETNAIYEVKEGRLMVIVRKLYEASSTPQTEPFRAHQE